MAGPRISWTAADVERVVAMRRAGEPLRAIEAATGLSRSVIWNKLCELGIPCPPRRRRVYTRRVIDPDERHEWTDAELDALIAEQMQCLPGWWAKDVRLMQIEEETLEYLSAEKCRELATTTQRGRNWRRRAGL